MDDEGITHIPDDMILSKSTESDPCFVRVFYILQARICI